MLENVEEFKTWGPLIEDDEGNHRPCPERKGETFKAFIQAIERQGYKVETRELRGCDYGAPTIRKRLFLIARCDGQSINWPEQAHGAPDSIEVKNKTLKPWKTAASIIDWSIPCPSIFERKRPLAENTLKRIARGIQRFVIENPKPFIVRIGQTGFGGDGMQYSIDDPLTTITSKAEHCLVAPFIVKPNHKYKYFRGQSTEAPLSTVTGKNDKALAVAHIIKHYGGMTGVKVETPFPTITGRGTQNQVVTSHLLKLRNNQYGQSVEDPMPTLTAGGGHVGEVRAFLIKYYGSGGQWQKLDEPMHTLSTRARLGLVYVKGEAYQIVDIGMRMLQPHELFAAQGFPNDYVFDRDSTGKPFTKTAQVAMCGNSVCPPVAEALVRANMTNQSKIVEVA